MFKKFFMIILCAAALVINFPLLVNATEEKECFKIVYTTDYVNARQTPSLDSHVIFIIEKGFPVLEIKKEEDFTLVSIDGEYCYIHSDYLTEEKVYNEEELRLMASIIFEQAGNQCEAGQQAVGIVVMNRVRSDSFPNTIYEVLWQKGQFFNPSFINFFNKCLSKYDNGEIPQSCIDAAKYALDGNTIVTYEEKDLDLSNIFFFSRYRKNPKYCIQDHQFS